MTTPANAQFVQRRAAAGSRVFRLFSTLCLVTACATGNPPGSGAPPVPVDPSGAGISAAALRVHRDAITVDTHIDTGQRLLFDPSFDLAARHTDGHIDIPRLREGGLDAAFFSIWVPGTVPGPEAARRALTLIDRVREAVRRHSGDLVLATSADDVRRAAAAHKVAVLLGMEGGHMIDGDLGLLRTAAALGVRYLTLTHSSNTSWADSSGDTAVHHGLTPFGKDVVRELNRLGVMVDVSHVSDETFYAAVASSRAPVIASHSSCRALVDHPRNMTDDMLRALSRNGGVVMINFVTTFIDARYREAMAALPPEVATRVRELNQRCGTDEACSLVGSNRLMHEFMASGAMPSVPWTAIVDHIDHAVQVAGIDHVGIGSDFDGATTPVGMEDVTHLPQITEALLARGYAPAAVTKILGGNILRVMAAVDAVARQEP